jgi:hypothetical protein
MDGIVLGKRRSLGLADLQVTRVDVKLQTVYFSFLGNTYGHLLW